MKKTDKYYDIIKDLVKQNRKYSGLEAILDDIIDDVYSHSEIIINSINNDGVIQSYLEKVVATSIITVPKKLGFHSELKHRIVGTQQAPELIEQKHEEQVDNTLVDKMINNITVENSNDKTAGETAESQISSDLEEKITDVYSEPEKLELPEEHLLPDNDLLNEPDIVTDEEPEELELNIDDGVGDGSDLQEITDDIEIENLNIISENDTIDDAGDNSLESGDIEEVTLPDAPDITEPEELPNFEMIETENLNILSDSAETEDVSIGDDVVEDSIVSDNNQQEQVSEFTDLGVEDDSLILTDDGENEDFDISDSIEDELLLQDGSDENPLSVIDDNGLEQIADEITTTLETYETASQDEIDFKPTDYSVFSYSTDKYRDDIDAKEIVNEIKDLASKHPELNIINVYNLKFKDKLTIPQVASELNMSEDNVIEALNELVAVVQ